MKDRDLLVENIFMLSLTALAGSFAIFLLVAAWKLARGKL